MARNVNDRYVANCGVECLSARKCRYATSRGAWSLTAF